MKSNPCFEAVQAVLKVVWISSILEQRVFRNFL